ncbi:hypothetical protein ACSBR2_010027 [Camellia fascicularis]
MDELPGALGTSASLALRLGQAIFSTVSLFFMCLDVEFYGYTAFCFLVTIMGLVIPWSLTFALVDASSVVYKRPSHQPGVMSVIIVGDWVLSFLSLAAACSTATVTDVLIDKTFLCSVQMCSRYQLSGAMVFLSWLLSLASSLINLWLLPSL